VPAQRRGVALARVALEQRAHGLAQLLLGHVARATCGAWRADSTMCRFRSFSAVRRPSPQPSPASGRGSGSLAPGGGEGWGEGANANARNGPIGDIGAGLMHGFDKVPPTALIARVARAPAPAGPASRTAW